MSETVFTAVKDSGKRQEFKTGSVRDTEDGKGSFDMIPTEPLKRLAVHYQNGAKKYGRDNWKKGQPLSRYISSAFRHLLSLRDGLKDEDHNAALSWNSFAFSWTANEIKCGRLPRELDDLGYWNDEDIQISRPTKPPSRPRKTVFDEDGTINNELTMLANDAVVPALHLPSESVLRKELMGRKNKKLKEYNDSNLPAQ